MMRHELDDDRAWVAEMTIGDLDALMRLYDVHLYWTQGASEYTATAFDGRTYRATGPTPSTAILALVATVRAVTL